MIIRLAKLRGRYTAAVLAASLMLLTPMKAFACAGAPSSFGPFKCFDNSQNIKSIFNIVILLAGLVCVALLIAGVLSFLILLAKKADTNKARKLFLNALIGLVIVVISWSIGTYALKLRGLDQNSVLPLQDRRTVVNDEANIGSTTTIGFPLAIPTPSFGTLIEKSVSDFKPGSIDSETYSLTEAEAKIASNTYLEQLRRAGFYINTDGTAGIENEIISIDIIENPDGTATFTRKAWIDEVNQSAPPKEGIF